MLPMVKKKGKKKKKKVKDNKCPRCKGLKEETIIEKLEGGGTMRVVQRCSLCYGSGKWI